MLTDLVVENFQSIKSAHFKLGRLTVVTGPTGSGKSSLLRALELAAFNKRGTGYIRQGETSCMVGFGSQEEGWFLAIERGGRGKDSYRIARQLAQHIHEDGTVEGCPGCFPGPDVQTFTKLGGEAPPEVLAVHRLDKSQFVSQFESPFLLSASGSEVARILGELTNVTLVYEAAREGARRRQRIAGDLKRAEAEVASLAEQLQQYTHLPVQMDAQERAEQAMARAQELAEQGQRLHTLAIQASQAAADVRSAQENVSAASPPSLEAVEGLLTGCQRLSWLVEEVRYMREEAARQQHFIEVARARENDAHQAVHDALEELGICPTCGQVIAPDAA